MSSFSFYQTFLHFTKFFINLFPSFHFLIKQMIGGNNTIKITTTNIISVRSVWERGYVEWVKSYNPDIILLQETKMYKDAKPSLENFIIPGYQGYYYDCTIGKGMHGTAMYTKIKPVSVAPSFPDFDDQGRCITMEFSNFFLINSYVPNAGRGLKKLEWKVNVWNPKMNEYINELRKKKPVVWAGDLNVAHEDIDIFRPEGHELIAGFTKEERAWFSSFLNQGYIDVFRHLNPNKKQFSFFTQYGNAKAHNCGWRLDYFVAHKDDYDKIMIKDIKIEDADFSDHVPQTLFVDKQLFKGDAAIEQECVVRLNDNTVFEK